MERSVLKWFVRFSILAIFFFAAIASSGCIQTHLMRDIFFHEEEKEVVYDMENVVDMSYQFTGDLNAFSYQDQENFEVKEDARWLTFTISLKLYVLPSSITEHLNYEDRNLRYLTVIISDPDNNIYPYSFEHSTLITLDPILEPTPGLWKVQIDSYGRGLKFTDEFIYYDEFSVSGTLNQPQ